MLSYIIIKRMIKEFVIIASGVSSFTEERCGDTVVSYMLWVILKTSLVSPRFIFQFT